MRIKNEPIELNVMLKELIRRSEEIEEHCMFVMDGRDQAAHMAALWKRCAKKLYSCEGIIRLLETNAKLDTENSHNKARAEKAESALAALKKDARMVAEVCRVLSTNDNVLEVADRIIEATKEADNGHCD